MSTEHQNYSLEHQRLKFNTFAAANALTITRQYVDHGKSGLNLKGRAGLQSLLTDVSSQPDFDVILVYDVSRWGRFQDVDESAYYEYVCRRAGVPVLYCAEPFANDNTAISSILKALKRLMAAEFSRELSAKVFSAQCNFVALGYKQGGGAGYGLRRVLVSQAGEFKQVLSPGERKSLKSDRVLFALGPPEEVAVVRKVFEWYVERRLGYTRIAAMLNACGILDERGRPWTRFLVRQILTSEKYIGNIVFNRTSNKLKARAIRNPPEMWIRHEGAFPASVPTDTFRLAEHARLGRSKHYTTTQLLDMLRQLAAEHGRVSGLLIDCAPGLPSAQMFRYRFGSLTEAYRLAGVVTPQQVQCTSTRARLHELRTSLMARALRCIQVAGGNASEISYGCFLINNEVVTQLQIVRAHAEKGGASRWRIRLLPTEQVDFVIAAIMEAANRDISHFLLIPRSLFKRGYFAIPSKRSVEVQDHRFETLDAVFGL
jgi:DNA invertase Pin-like site-specific DNA recombinase